jgi:hypothetical protein
LLDVHPDIPRLADDLVVVRDEHERAGATLVDHMPVTTSIREPETVVGQDRYHPSNTPPS